MIDIDGITSSGVSVSHFYPYDETDSMNEVILSSTALSSRNLKDT